MWGANTGCQLGYGKEMRDSLAPILFGGKIKIQNTLEEEKSEEADFKLDLGFNYVDVVCGSSQTLALIDKSPYLMCWGNADPVASTYSEVFDFDKPIMYDCGGKNAVILTEKGNLFKINLETKALEKVRGDTSLGHSTSVIPALHRTVSQEEQSTQGITQVKCGSDFILALKTDGNLYGLGQNKCGQLGQGDLKMREGFTVIESLLNEQIKSVEAGNQHACCIFDRADPL